MSADRAQPETPDCRQAESNENLNTSVHGPGLRRNVSRYNVNTNEFLRLSGNHFIEAFKKLLDKETKKEVKNSFMRRLLHSIFFFGHINDPQIKPEEFIHEQSLNAYKNKFQEVFEIYRTHLPRQSPYSILLEYVTKANDAKKPEQLRKSLKDINESLLWTNEDQQGVANCFAASVIAHSTNNAADWYYGASISYKGKVPRKIMISISALFVWDTAISYIVCCGDKGQGLIFPNVQCGAFWYNGKECEYAHIPPCKKCVTMFHLNWDLEYQETPKKQTWPYGNCAEVESLSNLLLSNEHVRNHVTEGHNNETIMRDNIESLGNLDLSTEGSAGENRRTMGRKDIEKAFQDRYEKSREKALRGLLKTRGFRLKDRDKLQLYPSELVTIYNNCPQQHSR